MSSPGPSGLAKPRMRLAAVWYAVDRWTEAKRFYGETLDLTMSACSDQAGWAAYTADDGLPIFLVRRPELAGLGGGATVTFEHPDLDELRERLLDAGADVDETLAQGDAVQILTFFDPDGNRLEASQKI